MYLAVWIVMSGLLVAAMLWVPYFLRSRVHPQDHVRPDLLPKSDYVSVAIAVELSLLIALEVSLMFMLQDIAVLPRPLPDALKTALLVGSVPFGIVALLLAVVVLFRIVPGPHSRPIAIHPSSLYPRP